VAVKVLDVCLNIDKYSLGFLQLIRIDERFECHALIVELLGDSLEPL
jgi:hypothetical protein